MERPRAEQQVLDRFFDDGRLVLMPTRRAKRLVVLDQVAQRFELGRTYPEHEVNAVLAQIHPDVAALRRYLVDEQFLTREAGVYWRSGGTVDLDGI
ncbi:MAG TPA: DUF2087 domain-containing protein [Marmoricola sp.]|jgi:hypothetical protein|nr:DUF2087 domain-containing protein [Marmoricola sp.]